MADTVKPAVDEVVLWRGSKSAARIWQFADADGLFPLGGSTFVLTVAVRGKPLLERRSDVAGSGLVVDVAAATVAWTPTTAESRQIPLGRLSSFELERRTGTGTDEVQEILIAGALIGRGGLNDD